MHCVMGIVGHDAFGDPLAKVSSDFVKEKKSITKSLHKCIQYRRLYKFKKNKGLLENVNFISKKGITF